MKYVSALVSYEVTSNRKCVFRVPSIVETNEEIMEWILENEPEPDDVFDEEDQTVSIRDVYHIYSITEEEDSDVGC